MEQQTNESQGEPTPSSAYQADRIGGDEMLLEVLGMDLMKQCTASKPNKNEQVIEAT